MDFHNSISLVKVSKKKKEYYKDLNFDIECHII